MPYLNSVSIIGHAGRESELRFTASGTAQASFSVAVNDSRKNKQTNEWETETEWFNVIVWGDAAERTNIAKGAVVYVAGKLKTRTWNDDQGTKHYRTELVADKVLDMTPKERGDRDSGGWQSSPAKSAPPKGRTRSDDPDDLPFE